MDGSGSRSVQIMMDPDPGGLKTNGSYRSGSTTLLIRTFWHSLHAKPASQPLKFQKINQSLLILLLLLLLILFFSGDQYLLYTKIRVAVVKRVKNFSAFPKLLANYDKINNTIHYVLVTYCTYMNSSRSRRILVAKFWSSDGDWGSRQAASPAGTGPRGLIPSSG